jgi:uncharacterized protein (DUF2141 family)/tetratricopeptide (TPR) repeat protein
MGLLLVGNLMLGNGRFLAATTADKQVEELSRQGWRTFLEVLAGDQGKFQLAVRQLEQSAAANPADIHNLYTLGRAYFYDAITHNSLASAEKARGTFARVLEVDPKHEALGFHGSTLVFLSREKDRGKFRQGVEEINRAVAQNPDGLTGRLSRGFTALALPGEMRSMLQNYDPVEDLEFASRAFEGVTFHYAPQAEVGSKAFLGEGYLLRGDTANAQSAFKAALAVPLPSDEGARAGRIRLQEIIRKRLNGSNQSVPELLAQAGLSTCNTCHLRSSEGAESQPSISRIPAKPAEAAPQTTQLRSAPQGELSVNIVGLKPSEGEVRVALFDSEKDFLQNPFKAGIAVVDGTQCRWQLNGLASGWYAVAVYQDKNGNGKLDRNMLGIPLEPYGFSNNARGILGPPSFRDARFQIAGSSIRIEVRVE